MATKIHTQGALGYVVDGLPAEEVLRHEDAPEVLGTALDDYRAATVEHAAAYGAHVKAERAAWEETPHPRGSEAGVEEVRRAVAEEAAALRAAAGASRRTARALADALDSHRADLGAIGARLALDALARERAAREEIEEQRRRRQTLTRGGVRQPRDSFWQRAILDDIPEEVERWLSAVASGDPEGALDVVTPQTVGGRGYGY